MKTTELFLKELDTLTALLDVNDLVALGLYTDKCTAYRARIQGNSPSYLKMPGKTLYPKESVREFILKRFHDGSIPVENVKGDMENLLAD